VNFRRAMKVAIATPADTRIGRRVSKALLRSSLLAAGYNRFDDMGLSGERWLVEQFLPRQGIRSSVDVGANQGTYSRMLLAALPGGLVAIDPDPRCAETLCRLAELNSTRMTFLPFALGAAEGKQALRITEASSFSSLSDVVPKVQRSLESTTVEVEVRTLDLLWRSGLLGDPQFMKVDVEGYEDEVLSGGREFIETGPLQIVQFEFGEHHLLRGHSLWRIADHLPGFRIYRLGRGRLVPVDVRSPLDSIPLFANYVGVRA
jgi:FkbM family methyltransferase